MTAGQDGYQHLALYHENTDQLLESVVPFIHDGWAAGEATVLIVDEETIAAVRASVSGHPRLTLMDPVEAYRNPNHAFAAYQRLTEAEMASGAAGARLLSRLPYDPNPIRSAGWAAFEHSCNDIFADRALTMLCLYDTGALPNHVIDLSRTTHPLMVNGGHVRANDHYEAQPGTIAHALDTAHDDLERSEPTLTVGVVTSPRHARTAVLDVLNSGASGATSGAQDFVAAVWEVLLNAFQHGRPPVHLRLWLTADRALCAITDHGTGTTSSLTGLGLRPEQAQSSGAGLWLARQLTDTLVLRHHDESFTVIIECQLTA